MLKFNEIIMDEQNKPKEKIMLYGKEELYFSVSGLVDSQIRQADKNRVKRVCSALLLFCFDKKLLKEIPFDSNGELRRNYDVYERHLTRIGKLYFYDLSEKWLVYTDRTNKIDNVKILEKWYSKLIEPNEN